MIKHYVISVDQSDDRDLSNDIDNMVNVKTVKQVVLDEYFYIRLAAGSFLTEVLSNEQIEDAKSGKLYFLEGIAWEPFQYWSGSQIWKDLMEHATSIKSSVDYRVLGVD